MVDALSDARHHEVVSCSFTIAGFLLSNEAWWDPLRYSGVGRWNRVAAPFVRFAGWASVLKSVESLSAAKVLWREPQGWTTAH